MKYLTLLLLLVCNTCSATLYTVGSGQVFTTIGSVPWESLNAGDTVVIMADGGPYNEKINATRVGTQANPITVVGLPDVFGNLPVLDATNAVTRTSNPITQFIEGLAVIEVYPASATPNTKPQWWVFDSLEIKNAVGGGSVTYTGSDGLVHPYGYNPSDPTHPAVDAGGIGMYKCDHITVKNCYIHDSGNCVFGKSSTFNPADPTDTRYCISDIKVLNNKFRNFGINGSTKEHATYVESIGVLYEGNDYGPPTTGDLGSALKDRSSGTIIRYNYIESGARMLDLVESQDGDIVLSAQTNYNNAWVYGNVFDNRVGDATNLIHWGGDTGHTHLAYYKTGTLYFYFNTIYIRRNQTESFFNSIFDVANETGIESVQVDNNLIYVTDAGSGTPPTVSWFIATGENTIGGTATNIAVNATFGVNYANFSTLYKSGFTHTGTVTGTSNIVTSFTPNFTDQLNGDFKLLSGSSAIGNAGSLVSAETANYPSFQFKAPVGTAVRDTITDVGALGFSSPTTRIEVLVSRTTAGVRSAQTRSAVGSTRPAATVRY